MENEICREFLRALDVAVVLVDMSLPHTWTLGKVPLDWLTNVVFSFFKKGIEGLVTISGPLLSSTSLVRSIQGAGEETLVDSRTSDSGKTILPMSRPWNNGSC